MDKSCRGFKKMLTGPRGRETELANTQKPLQSQEVPQKQTWTQREFGTIFLSAPGHFLGRGFQAPLPFPLSVLTYKLLSNKCKFSLTLTTLQLLVYLCLLPSPLYLPYKKHWPHSLLSPLHAMDLTIPVLGCKHRNTTQIKPLQTQESAHM